MALAPNALFRNDLTMLEPPQNRLSPSQIWPMENPVGTEQVRPQYLTAPDADVVPGVMWGDRMYSPRMAGGLNSAMDIGMGFAGSTGPGGIRAYHGSPHSFERFDTSRIGTGEGAQAYGHGLYFAEKEGVARSYRDIPSAGTPSAQNIAQRLLGKPNASGEIMDDAAVTRSIRRVMPNITDDELSAALASAREKPTGSMYEVNIAANPEHMLHWDKPLSEQHPVVQEALGKLGIAPHGYSVRETPAGYVVDFEGRVSRAFPTQEAAQKAMTETAKMQGKDITGAEIVRQQPGIELKLREAGIPGIRYLDQGSRHAPKLSDAERQQLQVAIADKQRLIADPRQQRDIAMHQADLDLFQRRLNEAEDVSHNLVVFDDATIEILRKYGLAGLMLGGGAAAGAQGQ
jgi:hypothetical protein